MQPESSLSRPGALVKIVVEVDGTPLQMYPHAGQTWVAGEPGKAYVLAVTSRHDGRLEVVTSIDGRNTLKDEEAAWMNSGMVLRPRTSYRFRGWRVDDNTVREFIFGDDPEDSVAVQATGSAANVGVIGIAAYRENTPKPYLGPPLYPTADVYARGLTTTTSVRSTNTSSTYPGPVAGAAASFDYEPQAEYDLSTGIGDEKADPVGRTEFKRTGTPDVLTIRYASYDALVRRGIIKCERCDPDPFPGNRYSRMRSPRART